MKEATLEEFEAAIKKAQEEGMTLEEIGERAHNDVTAVKRWILGERIPRNSYLRRSIIDALNQKSQPLNDS
jgi:hypothetical protein